MYYLDKEPNIEQVAIIEWTFLWCGPVQKKSQNVTKQKKIVSNYLASFFSVLICKENPPNEGTRSRLGHE